MSPFDQKYGAAAAAALAAALEASTEPSKASTLSEV